MGIQELRIGPDEILELVRLALERRELLPLAPTARVTDVALDHGHTGTHRGVPPTIVLQISSEG
jgi:hypothetical protein